MKKLLKITSIVLIALVLVITVAGCGNKGTENNTKDDSKSKTYNIFNNLKDDYVLSLEGKEDMGNGEEYLSMTMAVKGDNMYMDIKSDSESATIVYKDGYTYLISHDEKMYMVMEGKDDETFDDMSIFTAEDLDKIKDEEYVSGKETIEGTEYFYEEYTDENEGTIRFYYSGDDLKYIKNIDGDDEELIKVNNISSKVDDSLFEIPADYEKIEF